MSKLSDSTFNNGRWTKFQHEKFIFRLELYGKNWKKIEQLVGTRTGSQIRSHAQKYFLKTRRYHDGSADSNGNQESHSHHFPILLPPKHQQPLSHPTPHSYYMTKILTTRAHHDNFNFWQQFIDTKYCNYEHDCSKDHPRNDSFALFDTCNDSKQETSICNNCCLGQSIQ